MSYIPITEDQTNPFAPITSELLKQLRDNPIAIAEGDPSAPRVERDAIETDAINRSKIETATNSISGTLNNAGDSVVVNMNNFSFFPATSGTNITFDAGATSNPSDPSFRLTSTDIDNPQSYSVAWRYIVA